MPWQDGVIALPTPIAHAGFVIDARGLILTTSGPWEQTSVEASSRPRTRWSPVFSPTPHGTWRCSGSIEDNASVAFRSGAVRTRSLRSWKGRKSSQSELRCGSKRASTPGLFERLPPRASCSTSGCRQEAQGDRCSPATGRFSGSPRPWTRRMTPRAATRASSVPAMPATSSRRQKRK